MWQVRRRAGFMDRIRQYCDAETKQYCHALHNTMSRQNSLHRLMQQIHAHIPVWSNTVLNNITCKDHRNTVNHELHYIHNKNADIPNISVLALQLVMELKGSRGNGLCYTLVSYQLLERSKVKWQSKEYSGSCIIVCFPCQG